MSNIDTKQELGPVERSCTFLQTKHLWVIQQSFNSRYYILNTSERESDQSDSKINLLLDPTLLHFIWEIWKKQIKKSSKRLQAEHFNRMFHSLNSALLSRCRVIVLNKLPPDSVRKILEKALKSKDIFVRKSGEKFEKTSKGVSIDEEAVDYLAAICDGDARTALNCLEIAISKHEAEGNAS